MGVPSESTISGSIPGVDGIEAGLAECAEFAESHRYPKVALVADVIVKRSARGPRLGSNHDWAGGP